MIYELERIWKEAIVRCGGQLLLPIPSKYTAGLLTTRQSRRFNYALAKKKSVDEAHKCKL